MFQLQASASRTPRSCAVHKLNECSNFSGVSSSAQFGAHTLTSHFQPIYGLSHQRPIGYEALLRSRAEDGTPFSPHALFGSLPADGRSRLDRLSHRLHLRNYLGVADNRSWLFLNMTPEVFLLARKAQDGHFFANLLEELDFPPHRLVIEVLEEHVRDDRDFESAVAYFRELGCLIALDDFGAGSSNFDRVWKIRPQIVKLDRSLIVQSANSRQIRRLLPQMVSLLHEAGAMVLVEGIETPEEACIALDADADFAQGYLFGRPAPEPCVSDATDALVEKLWATFEDNWRKDRKQHKEYLSPYINAIGYASVLLSAGRPVAEACASFLELPLADFCYLLDREGRQIGVNEWSAAFCPDKDPRLAPLWDSRGARWARSPYFRRAIENFGRVQVTRPYLSVSSARLCITVSVSFKLGDTTCVICGDLRNP